MSETTYRLPVLEREMARYKRAVEEAPELMAPVFRMGFVGGQPGGVEIPLPQTGRSPTEFLFMLAHAVEDGVLPSPDWVLFASEGWLAVASEPGALDNIERGELEARKKIGMDGIGEALIVNYANADGTTWGATQEFERKPALRAVVWGKTSMSTQDPDDEVITMGAVPDALRVIVGLKVDDA